MQTSYDLREHGGGVPVGKHTGLQSDPLRNFKFLVHISKEGISQQFAKLGFMSVSGLSSTTEVIPYREGGNNTTTRKMPGQSDFPPVTLARGISPNQNYQFSWYREIFAIMQGTGRGGQGNEFRINFEISVLHHPENRGRVRTGIGFKVYNAWPQSIAYSDLDAGGNALLIEQMVLAHEGWDVWHPNTGWQSRN